MNTKRRIGSYKTDRGHTVFHQTRQATKAPTAPRRRRKADPFGPGRTSPFIKDLPEAGPDRLTTEHRGLLITKTRELAAVWSRTADGKRGELLVTLPIDSKTGAIPKDAAIARLMDVENGNRNSDRERNVAVDLGIDAKKVHQKDEADAFVWAAFPNERDLTSIDDSTADWWKWPDGLDPKEYGFKPGKMPTMVSIQGSKTEQAKVLAILNRNFTAPERRLMRGLSITISNKMPSGVAGYYQRTIAKGVSLDRIVVRPGQLNDESPDAWGPSKGLDYVDNTLTHEVIHFLRDRDEKRKGLARRPSEVLVGSDRDIEEAFTEFETAGRSRSNSTKVNSGYYRYVRDKDKPEAMGPDVLESGLFERNRQGFIHDQAIARGWFDAKGKLKSNSNAISHALKLLSEKPPALAAETIRRDYDETTLDIAQTLHKNKRGVRAWKGALAHFEKSAISRARISGGAEAIDTFWRYQAKDAAGGSVTVATHIFSPKGTVKREKAKDIAVGSAPAGGRLYEWQDGKKMPARLPKP
jgi:hypothetical protein